MKPKFEKRFAVVESVWEQRGNLCEFTEGYVPPTNAYKSKRKAQNVWKRLTRNWYVHEKMSDFASSLDDLMSRETYDFILQESTAHLVHVDLILPDFEERLVRSEQDKGWRAAFSGLPDLVQFRLIKEFNIQPYQVIEIDVEMWR